MSRIHSRFNLCVCGHKERWIEGALRKPQKLETREQAWLTNPGDHTKGQERIPKIPRDMTEDWILPQSLEVVMGHQEINQLWRQAWTDGAQREALGEENELERIRRKERTVHIIQQTQPAASAPRWVWATGQTVAGSPHRQGACCCLELVTATCSTTGTLHPQQTWLGLVI